MNENAALRECFDEIAYDACVQRQGQAFLCLVCRSAAPASGMSTAINHHPDCPVRELTHFKRMKRAGL